jgi:hypothetical protein
MISTLLHEGNCFAEAQEGVALSGHPRLLDRSCSVPVDEMVRTDAAQTLWPEVRQAAVHPRYDDDEE